MKIIGIVGTNSDKSTNRDLLKYIRDNFNDKFDLELAEIFFYPLMEEDVETPESVLNIAKKIEDADAIIIAAPEYDHAPTAALINFLAWMSINIHPLAGKSTLIVSASYGGLGSPRAQSILHQILTSPGIQARVMNRDFLLSDSKSAFDKMGKLVDTEKANELDKTIDEFIRFTEMVIKEKNIVQELEYKWDEKKVTT